MVKNILLFLILTSFLAWSSEPQRTNFYLDWFLTKLSLCKWAQVYKSNLRKRYISQKLPKSSYQKLFQKSQLDIGISEDELLPVGKIELEKCEDPKGYAVTSVSDIMVVDDNLKKLSYGSKRITALHEAYHHRFGDATFIKWALSGCMKGFLTLTCVLTVLEFYLLKRVQNRSMRLAGYVLSPFFTFALNSLAAAPVVNFLTKNFVDYKEFRADKCAVQHSQCYKCVEDFAQNCHNNDDRYMTKVEAQYYIDRFKSQNLTCSKHRNTPVAK